MAKKINSIALALLALIMFSMHSCKQTNEELPNIIYILADDMGYGDLACLNPDSKIPTPNMDRISEQGMIFTDAHSPSAVCTPTRYGIITGRYCFRTHLKSGVLLGYSKPLIDPERYTVANLLGEAGYFTACIGKWHLGLEWPKKDKSKKLFQGGEWAPESTDNIDYDGIISGGPTDVGFDFSFIIPASLDMTPYCYISNKKLIAPISGFTDGQNSPRGVFWRPGDIQEGFTVDGVLPTITDQAVKFIHRRAKEKTPFFLYFPLTAPHTPWLPSENHLGQSGAGLYGDFVNQVDHTVGLILAALEETDELANTLLIVTSDNGAHWTRDDKSKFPHLANAPFSGMKSDAWEGGHHVPFILQWPERVKPGSYSSQVTTLTDLMATCAGLTETDLPLDAGPDSYDMLPAILGENLENSIRPNTIHHSISGVFAIRMGEYKLIEGKGSGGWSYKGTEEEPKGQLYNITIDPEEQHNLYETMPDIVDKLSKNLQTIITQGYSKN
ncbi:MAG: arylsulfatase [Bacteroidales bacterium]|nr:arylsulfatase [Bacteroidales bacterium]